MLFINSRLIWGCLLFIPKISQTLIEKTSRVSPSLAEMMAARPGFNIAQECKTRLRGNSLTMWADSTITHFWEESLQKLNMKPQSHMKENLAATIKCFGYRVNDAFMRCGAYQTQIIQRLSPHALGRYLMWNSPFHQTWKDYYYYYYWCLFHNILSFLLGK